MRRCFAPVAVVVKGDTAPHLYTPTSTGHLRTFPTITCTGRCSRISTTASSSSPGRSPTTSAGRPRRRRRPDSRDVARPAAVRLGRRVRCGRRREAHEDTGRNRVHPQRAAAQRARDDRRTGDPAARSPPDRPERGVPPPSVRTGRLGQRDRSDLAGDGADPRARAMDPARRPGLSRPSPPTGSSEKATSSGSTRASTGRDTPPTTAGPGSPASIRSRMPSSRPTSAAGGPSSTPRSTFSSRACQRSNSARRPSRPTTAFGPGSTTSIWRTGSAPRAPKCRSSERILVQQFDERLIMQPGMVARLRASHLGGRRFRLSIGRHCGRDRYGMGQTQRLNLRTVRIDSVSTRRRRRVRIAARDERGLERAGVEA